MHEAQQGMLADGEGRARSSLSGEGIAPPMSAGSDGREPERNSRFLETRLGDARINALHDVAVRFLSMSEPARM